MKTIEVNLFEFNELTEKAQLNAINNNREINTDFEWYEPTTEEWLCELPLKGFEATKIYFSGFYSQGDGLMFEYIGINNVIVEDFLNTLNLSTDEKTLILNNIIISAEGKHRGQYYHEKSVNHDIYIEANNPDNEELINKISGDLESYIISEYQQICRQYYRELNKYCDYLTSDEAIKETLIANEYFFKENGSNATY